MKTSTKPTNPKDALGVRKVPGFSVIPQPVLAELGVALLEGAAKYGRHNYRRSGVRASVYADALWRHVADWWEGRDLDPDPNSAGLHNLTKAIACLVVLRDAMLQGNWVDDRPPKAAPWLGRLNALTAELLERHPSPKPPECELVEALREGRRAVENRFRRGKTPWSSPPKRRAHARRRRA